MHGPGHLFCEGCDLSVRALAVASWAGWCKAKGQDDDANKYAAQARGEFGRVWLSTPLLKGGQLEVRLIGGEMDELAIESLVLALEIHGRRVERRTKAMESLPDYSI